MNLDDHIEGIFNPLNPANWEDKLSTFESEDLSECLEYAKETNAFEPLENAIFIQEIKVKKALGKIDFCISAMSHTDNVLVINKLIEIRRELL